MNEELNVYELDTDALMTDIEEELTIRGYDVREQVPAGVWWFRTEKMRDEACQEIGALFERMVQSRLHPVVP